MDDLYSANPSRLAKLLALAASQPRACAAGELGDALRAQLTTPMLLGFKPSEADAGDDEFGSFLDVLRHPAPPLELLVLMKDFAKAGSGSADDPMPTEVARVLYYAAIAVARARIGARISTLEDGELLEGLTWASNFAWVDAATRSVIEQGISLLRRAPS